MSQTSTFPRTRRPTLTRTSQPGGSRRSAWAGVGAVRQVLLCAVIAAVALANWPATGVADTATYDVVGQYSWTAPARVFSATFDVYGAQGAAGWTGAGGLGGRATATIAVTPGQTFSLNVGGTGGANGAGGANGGAQGGGPYGNGGGGGGASDARTTPFGLADRLLVGGGGGGGGNTSDATTLSHGGTGGGVTGATGNMQGGQGGTAETAGAGADGGGAGAAGVGGTGTCSGGSCGGGGGGGWYGGGGAGEIGGGGGGSGHGPDGVTFQSGARAGDGQVVITYVVTPKPPDAVTGAASNIAETEAVLAGSVNANTTATTYHFEYGTSAAYGTSTSEYSAGSDGVPHDKIQAISGLAPRTAYHFRIVATSGSGTSAGADAVFQTTGQAPTPAVELPEKPAVATAPATGIGQQTATLHGALYSQGAETAYHFEYGPTTAYGSRTAQMSLAATGIQFVAGPLAGLELGKGVHFRLVATNAGGTTAGADTVFATLGRMKPVAVTSNVRGRDRVFPHTYAVTGRIVLPAGVSASAGCKGTITVQIKNATKTILVRRAALATDCTYRQKMTLKVRSRLRGARGKLRVVAKFSGNAALFAREAKEAVALFGTP